MVTKIDSVQKKKVHKLALYCIILGTFGAVLGFFTAIPAIVCGHIALYKIKKYNFEIDISYKRMAFVGLLAGYFFSVLSTITFHYLYTINFIGNIKKIIQN